MNPLKECIAASIVLVAGMARMETDYRGEAEKFGVILTVFNEDKAGRADTSSSVD